MEIERKYIKCKTCNDWHWSDKLCNPVFTIEYEEGEKEIYAFDHEEASEKFAEYYNETHDYDLMDQEIEIKVIDSKGVEKNFKIGAEQSVNYWSKEI
jgi:hypothetical protein